MTAGAQHQTVGERGIGVQISGNGATVTVYAGSAELGLTRKHLRQAEPKTELQLFRVDLRATTLVGREGDLSALDAWLASDRPVSVRCMTGRAGAGKTRLALELCELAEQAGWTAGFARYSQFPEFVKHTAEWRWDKPMLVVIDYAAALARDLRTWLEILARPEAQTGGNKLRLLLLERHAEREFGWWADLMRPVSFSDPAPDELADPLEPVPLLSLTAVEDRRGLLAEAMRLAGQIVGVQPIPRPPSPGANADFDRRLGDDTINNEPLYLMMAGAEAIRTGASAALALTRSDLAERAASRERERLNRLASEWGLSDKLVAHLALCVTLQGGSSADEALQLVTEEPSRSICSERAAVRTAAGGDTLSSSPSGAIKPMPEAEIAKAVQLLDLMLEFFADDSHWTRGCYDDGNGGHCLVGALLHLSRKHRLPTAPAAALLQDAMPWPGLPLVHFNDSRCDSVAELHSVILEARRLAHDHGEQERAATAVKAWLLAQIEKKRAATADSMKTAPHEPFAPERLAA